MLHEAAVDFQLQILQHDAVSLSNSSAPRYMKLQYNYRFITTCPIERPTMVEMFYNLHCPK